MCVCVCVLMMPVAMYHSTLDQVGTVIERESERARDEERERVGVCVCPHFPFRAVLLDNSTG